eukprot:scaffold43632_cov36-Phaeocystis_antarctica.AAC.1
MEQGSKSNPNPNPNPIPDPTPNPNPGSHVAGDSSLLRLTMLLLAHPIALALVAVALLACCGC